MKASILAYLRCPTGCETDLSLHVDSVDGDEVIAGTLACTRCNRRWPIELGIPRLLPDVLLTSATQKRVPTESVDDTPVRQRAEMAARDAQAADYDRMWHLNLFGLVEVPVTLLHMGLAPTHVLLEAGCGTGRMTRQFARRCQEMVAVDFSWESLMACRTKLSVARIQNVHLLQADICHLPFRTELFDRVVSCQVLEHIPSPTARACAVGELARVLRCGGNLTLSAYQYSLLMRLFGDKEGEHDGGIYFYRFTRDELKRLLEDHVCIEAITGALVYHYLARCRK